MAVAAFLFLSREIFLVHVLSCKNWDLFMLFDEGLVPSPDAKENRKNAVSP